MNPTQCHLCGNEWFGDGPCPDCFNEPTLIHNDHKLTERSAAHLANLLDDITNRVRTKYIKGHIEHGGDLQDLTVVQLLDEAINEAMDQVVYLLTLKRKLG